MSDWTIDTAPPFAAELVRGYHDVLAAMAREHFQREGRGLVSLIWRGGPPSDVLTIAEVRIGYWPAARYRQFTAGHETGPIRELADHLLQRVATYDSTTEMVVMAVVGPQFLTCPFTIPLDQPIVVPEADGIH